MQKQTGAGLLTALILVMLITAIISTIATVTHYDIRRHRMLRHAETAQALVNGATKMALEMLSTDGLYGEIDSRQDIWATPLPAYPVEGGYVRGEIRPLSSRINLYSLVLPIKSQREQYISLFKRLCTHLGISNSDATALIRNIPSLHSPMDAIFTLDETVSDRLSPYLYYYPVLDGFNVNLLNGEMWQLITGMDANQADMLVNDLRETPVSDVNSFIRQRFPDHTNISNMTFTNKTRFFEIAIEAKIGDMIRRSTTQVFRVSAEDIQILQRTTIE